jgi:hypothetical protein
MEQMFIHKELKGVPQFLVHTIFKCVLFGFEHVIVLDTYALQT